MRNQEDHKDISGRGSPVTQNLASKVAAASQREKKYPLTPQQYGLWVEWKLHPDNSSYNTCVKLRLDGALDVDRFRDALQYVVQFFDSLRVYCREEAGIPYQYIKPNGTYTLDYQDFSDGSENETETLKKKAENHLAKTLATPIDLTEFPICRAALVKTANTRYYFIGLVPHIISDGASAVLFLESVSIAYNKGWDGLVEAYGETQKNWDDYFADMAAKTKTPYEDQVAHWSDRLKSATHTVDFSPNPVEDATSVKNGRRVYFDFSPEMSDRIKKHARANRTTPFNVLVCLFSILMNRSYAQDDVMIGYPVNIRPAGYRHHFGFFVNIIPLRTDMRGNPTYQELLDRVSKTRKADRAHQDFPAFDIVKTIRSETDDFDGRVFNISMAQTVSRLVNLNLDGITSTPLEAEYNDVNDDLSLSYEMMEDGRIGLWLEYRLNMFNHDFITQMMQHIERIAKTCLDNPDTKLSNIALLKPNEKSDMLAIGLGPEQNPNERGESIWSDVFTQAKKTPDAIALKDEHGTLSYAEMINEAEGLAHHLIDSGATQGEFIIVNTERGRDQIISLLAVMAAGCAYVPVAYDTPEARVKFIIEDTNAKHVLTTKTYENVNCIDPTARSTKDVNLPHVSSNDRAYVIYTSGSTGTPKGVVLRHGQVTPRLQWLRDTFPLSSADRILQNTSTSFDVSVAEIFWPLTMGASLILTNEDNYKDAHALLALIKSEAATATCCVPSLLNGLVSIDGFKSSFSSMRLILSAGEPLSPHLAARLNESTDAKLINIYGPTEAAIYATWHDCSEISNDYLKADLPIGRPLGDTSTYILDADLNPCAPMISGDLYIGGLGIADDYLGREDLTKSVFIDNPFGKGRLYKTGDKASYSPNGEIRYLGRADHQVKIRGYRIELEGIQSVISSVEGVIDCAVSAHGSSQDSLRLVAYYVSDNESDDIESRIKKEICANLPPYMMPSFFIPLDEIPKTSGGKVNRRRLPTPEAALQRSQNFVAAETETQKQIAEIWSKILKIPADKIGIHDSFFNLGGDSLMAIQFVSTAEEVGLTFRTEALFERRTIAELEQAVTDHEVSPQPSGDNIHVLPQNGGAKMLPRQAKFFADGMANPHYWNRIFAFTASHNVKEAHLKSAFEKLFDLHPGLKTYFRKDSDGEYALHYASKIDVSKSVMMIDVSDASDQDAEIVKYTNDCQSKMRLDDTPLLRALMFKTGPKTGQLVLISHHILIDIIASRIVFEDFIKAYERARRKLPISIATPTTPPFEWAAELYRRAEENDYSAEISYWENMPNDPNINPDFEITQDALTEQYSKTYVQSLSKGLTRKILRDMPRAFDAGVQDILLAGFAKAIADRSGAKDIVINLTGHGRYSGDNAFDLSRSVGWFNTVYPAKISVPDDIDRLVQKTAADMKAVPADDGIYNILRYIKKHPSLIQKSNNALFFNYVSQIDALIPDGLPFEPIEPHKAIKASDPANALKYLLYVEAGVYEGQMQIHFTYSEKIFCEKTIEKICNDYVHVIETLSETRD